MPISGDEFELGAIAPSLYVLEFLRTKFPNAYTTDELQEILFSKEMEISQQEIASLLKELIDAGKIESKTIRDMIYYRYQKGHLGFRVK